jgi:predicted NBD/HSP70 family sugar kinase
MDPRAAVAEATGLRVQLENAVNLAVLGERWLGAGRGYNDFAFGPLGTGLGAGIIVRGELPRGAWGAAGEIGYLPFGPDPFEPESLRVGTLERVLSTQGLRAAYRTRTGRELELEVPAIFAAADTGDAAADALLRSAARMLAPVVAALASVTNPQVVILGGSIGARLELLQRVRAELPHCHPYPPAVERTILKENVALACAAAAGLQRLAATLFPCRIAYTSMPPSDPRDPVEVE